jgi:DNA-binding NarL/FixJ family response regulator
MPTRCLIVDDSQPFPEPAHLIERDGLHVAGGARTGDDAVRGAERPPPNVILVDVFLGAESGLELARELVEDDSLGATLIRISTHTSVSSKFSSRRVPPRAS